MYLCLDSGGSSGGCDPLPNVFHHRMQHRRHKLQLLHGVAPCMRMTLPATWSQEATIASSVLRSAKAKPAPHPARRAPSVTHGHDPNVKHVAPCEQLGATSLSSTQPNLPMQRSCRPMNLPFVTADRGASKFLMATDAACALAVLAP